MLLNSKIRLQRNKFLFIPANIFVKKAHFVAQTNADCAFFTPFFPFSFAFQFFLFIFAP